MLCASSRSCAGVRAPVAPRPARRGISTKTRLRALSVIANQASAARLPAVQRSVIASIQRTFASAHLERLRAVPEADIEANKFGLGAAAALAAIASLYLLFDEVNAAEETISAVVANASSMKDGEYDISAIISPAHITCPSMREAKVGETKILLVRLEGKFYATDLNCPHYGAPLNTGVLCGDSISCPWHDARFSIKTGALESAPSIDGLHTYLVTIKSDDVIVTVPKTPKPRHAIGKCEACDTRTFVIVGGGAAGAVAAEALRQDGFKGKIIVLTEENKLPYDRTALSKAPGTPSEKITLRDEAFWRSNDVEVHRERKVRSIDVQSRTITFEDGSTMSYDSALLATGARPRTLNVPGADLENIRVLRNVEDSAAIASFAAPDAKVVVIGSSFIGMELASALKKGKKVENVTVVGMEKVPFERVLGTEVGEIMQGLAEDNGIKFVMQRTAARFEGKNGKVTKVVLDDKTELPADLVVMGAGVIPNTQIVKNLPLNRDGSITVDKHMKAAEGVYAAGDIARFPWQGEDIRVEHWAVAQNQGRVAAHNMAGKNVPYENVPFFWTRSFDLSLTYAGHASSYDEGDKKKRQFVAFYVKNNNVKAVAALGRGPQAIAATELFRTGKMPSAADIRKATDVDLTDVLRRTQNFAI